ncbi:MAG: GntR family transcriptional regulator, partial [Frankiales bacterium]|nr:GntR family transcriptional regulator [Frankiales bacterium]
GRTIRAHKTAELIAEQVRQQIVRWQLRAGDSLPSEVELMSQFGVSRPTLREAFRILETEALISVRRGSRGGARILAPDLSVAARYVGLLLQLSGATFGDVYEARIALEPVCARLFATRRTPEGIALLHACIAEMRRLAEPVDGLPPPPSPAVWSRLALRFHQLLITHCGNKTLAVQGGVLQDIVATHLSLLATSAFSAPDYLEVLWRRVHTYEALVALIEAGDAAGAEAHWREHMEDARAGLFRGGVREDQVVDLFT